VNGALASNLLEPAVLFFALGLVAGAIRSNLEVPAPVTRFLSLYLLMAIGFKGGLAIADGGLGGEGLALVLAAVALAVAVPAWSFLVLRRRVPGLDAAAIAATYGSVSAVTFIAATRFLLERGETVSGAMTVALVMMESPAIVMAVVLAGWVRARQGVTAAVTTGGGDLGPGGAIADDATTPNTSMRSVLHEALTDGAQLLLIGSLVIGAVSGERGSDAMAPFVDSLFNGLLSFFLLDMGLLVARQLREARDLDRSLLLFGVVAPVVNALLAIGVARAIGAGTGNATMLAVLAASASYIVVPAVVRSAIPEARPSRYFTLALGVTFPFNLIAGIPLYAAIVNAWWGS
jgi:hypothetical protein